MHEILMSFVGNRDPYCDAGDPDTAEEPQPGPVLSLLRAREFSRTVLFCTGSAYVERARMLEEIAREEGLGVRFNFVSLEIESPIDYEEIYGELKTSVDTFLRTVDHQPRNLSVLLDPGTPQMQTAWFLMAASGYINVSLLQGVPPRFAGGAYKVRTVDLTGNVFPGLRIDTGGSEIDSAPAARAMTTVDESGQWIPAATPEIVGASDSFRAAMDRASGVAQYDMSIVVRGETGTGKEVVARHIHACSRRSTGPFVAVNCAAVSPSLAESEFFGHVKGAFTGADRDRLGRFRAAEGGTVFLDEIGDLAEETQAKLLRVLENRVIVPVGSDEEISVDVRVVAATNRDLEAMVESGDFRHDLYSRLAQFTVLLPPLRDRQDDIPLLLRHFIDRWNNKYGEEKGLSEDTTSYLVRYPWPGNVRELQNAVEATFAMGRSSRIGPELLPPAILRHFNQDRSIASIPSEIPADGLDLKALLHNMEKSYYEEALKLTGGNAEQAAGLLGLHGATFRKAARERLDVSYREAEDR